MGRAHVVAPRLKLVALRLVRLVCSFADNCAARLLPGYIREDLRTGYGLRFSTEIYRSKRFSTNTYRKLVLFLEKSPKISGNLREFTGECNLEILCFNSLLIQGSRPESVAFPSVCQEAPGTPGSCTNRFRKLSCLLSNSVSDFIVYAKFGFGFDRLRYQYWFRM